MEAEIAMELQEEIYGKVYLVVNALDKLFSQVSLDAELTNI